MDASANKNSRLRVPYLVLSPTGGQFADTAGAEKFNSLRITLRKQASDRLSFQAAYTWSRALTNVVANGPISGDPLDLHQMYGPSTKYRRRGGRPRAGAGLRGILFFWEDSTKRKPPQEISLAATRSPTDLTRVRNPASTSPTIALTKSLIPNTTRASPLRMTRQASTAHHTLIL